MATSDSNVKSHWAYVNGLRMHARTSAHPISGGPTLLLVHGIGITSRYWIPTIVHAGREFKTYAPDFPGFGLSDKPERTQTLSELSELARWLDAGRSNRSSGSYRQFVRLSDCGEFRSPVSEIS